MKSNNTKSLRFLLLLVAAVVMALGAWFWWTDAVSSVDPKDPTAEIFVVSRGEGVRSIAAKLSKQNLIRSPTGFFILVKLSGMEMKLQAGDFRLNRTMDTAAIAQELTHGTLDVWVTTLEGWRVEEIANKLAKDLDIPEKEFLKYAKEGYMFPDTYLIPRDATAAAIAKIFTDNFDKKISGDLREQTTRTGLTFDEVIILASIVEREGRTDEDRPVIAGILLKRLKADWPLQADATIQYALGYQPFEKNWWKKWLDDNDKKFASPFNTYRITGLPPAPIANPGLAAIRAVISPKETEYWYYLHDTDGKAHYAKTIEEHSANISKYLQ